MPDHLFVYGTLRRHSTHPFAKRLAAEAKYLGPAHVLGRLYNFGAWPGLVLDENGEWIEGDLYRLGNSAKRLLAVLDGYEGAPKKGGEPLFRRVLVPVRLRHGPCVESFVYALTDADPGRPRLFAGKWRNHLRRRTAARNGLR